MNTILDPKEKPIPSKNILRRGILNHFWRHWSKWVSILALVVAAWSAWTAHKATEQSRTLAKLDFRPDIRIKTWFKKIAGFPPHIRLTNLGPVDAIQISVKMSSHRYYPKVGKIAVTAEGSENNAFFQIIKPRDTKIVKFQKGWLETNARLQEPPQHNILEIRLQYRRSQDLEAYDLSAFYFINPDGRWVSENSSSLRDSIYQTLKEAAKVQRASMSKHYLMPTYEGGDLLHENKEP